MAETLNNENQVVVYDHTTGVPYLLDPVTNTIKRTIDLSPQTVCEQQGEYRVSVVPNERDLLKNKDGKYRTEVKNECKRLYFQGVTGTEIARRTGVGKPVIDRWIYGSGHDGSAFKCWKAERKRFLEEARQANLGKYGEVEGQALDRISEFLASKGSQIKNSRELRDFADALAKVIYVPGGRDQTNAVGGNNKTQININTTHVVPLTPDEARNILIADPIRLNPPKDVKESPIEEATISVSATSPI